MTFTDHEIYYFLLFTVISLLKKIGPFKNLKTQVNFHVKFITAAKANRDVTN